MNAYCRIKPDCPRWTPPVAEGLVTKYGGRVPRYTSYPTAPHFKENVGESLYREWLATLDRDEPVSLYLHIPFCERLCWYCGCNTAVVHRRAPVADYVEHLASEIAMIGEAIGFQPSAARSTSAAARQTA
jgi:oxygen-independent coproporphyrinogen III oxidase